MPCEATKVERKAIQESAYSAGASEVYIIEEPMAAAIGAGLRVEEAEGSMVIDIGGGTSEIAMISLNGLVQSLSVRTCGDKFDEAIINHIRRTHGIAIGESTAEKIKHTIGSAYDNCWETESIDVRGLNVAQGVPREITVKSEEILSALQEPLESIVQGVHQILESSPPELSSDVAKNDMMLTGGGALLRGLDRLIEERTGVPARAAEAPLNCVAEGGGIALSRIELNQKYI